MKLVNFLALSIVVLSSAPVFAQNEITNNQPVVGHLNKDEARIQEKLTADFNQGLIDESQLTEFQRDFDGILDHESQLQSAGMNEAGKKKILKDLTAFEARLDKQAGLTKTSKPTITTK